MLCISFWLYIRSTQIHKAMKTTEDWIEYYNGASRNELNAVLKRIGKNWVTRAERNERDAVIALLA